MRLRRQHRWGAHHIAHDLAMAASTVQAILRSEGLGRLDTGDRAKATEPINRYQRDRPGELVHVDVKKLGAIPPGGGWKVHGRGNAPAGTQAKVGYRYLHTAVDDRTRVGGTLGRFTIELHPVPQRALSDLERPPSGRVPPATSSASRSSPGSNAPTTAADARPVSAD